MDLLDGIDNPLDNGLNPFKAVKRKIKQSLPSVGGRDGAEYPPLPAAQADDLKTRMLNHGVTGLSYLASALDKPARAVRGVLGGNAREALAAIPFSDSLGITDPHQNRSMESLLQQHNLIGRANPNAGFWGNLPRNAAILGAEVGLDPLTYASFGASAATKAGVLARKAGLGTKWAHRDLIRGFTHLEPELLAAGKSADEIAHMVRGGARVAPQALLDTAAKQGVKLGVGTPLAGALGFGIPMATPFGTVGTGKIGQAIAGTFDRGWARAGRLPGVATARQWFDTSAGRSADPMIQRAYGHAGQPASQKILADTGLFEMGARQKLEPILQQAGGISGGEQEAMRLLRGEAEKVHLASDQASWAADFARRSAGGQIPGMLDPTPVEGLVRQHWDTLKGIGSEANALGQAWHAQATGLGLPKTALEDAYAEYAARQSISSKGFPTSPGAGAKTFQFTNASDIMRKKALRDIPGGTAQIDTWAMDPRLSGSARTLGNGPATAAIRDKLEQAHLGRPGGLLSYTPERQAALDRKALSLGKKQAAGVIRSDMERTHLAQPGGLLTYTPEYQAALDRKSRAMSAWLKKLDPLHAEMGIPAFDLDTIASTARRGELQSKAIGAGQAFYHAAGGYAQPHGPGMVNLDDLLTQVGLRSHTLPGGVGADGAQARMYEALAAKGVPYMDMAQAGANPQAAIKQWGVTTDQAAKLKAYMQGWNQPHEMRGFLNKTDTATNLFKNLAYPLWPASHVRNLTSALYNNFLFGTPVGAYADAARIMRRTNLDKVNWSQYGAHVAAYATPEEKAQALERLAFAHAKVYKGAGGSQELVGRHGLAPVGEKIQGGERLTQALPGSGRNAGHGLVGDTLNLIFNEGIGGMFRKDAATGKRLGMRPWEQAGLGGRVEDKFAPLVAGRKVGTDIEDSVRLANYLGNLRGGMTPDAAGALTKKIHFDYQDLTPFESNVMRRLVPFYTYMRKNLPFQASIIGQTPGRLMPQLRAATNVGDESKAGYTPDYLSSGVAIPVGTGVDPNTGAPTTRYLNSLGTPWEEAFQHAKFRTWDIGGHQVTAPDLAGTAMSYMGTANPYLKAPLEWMTDRSFHTGRQLSDMRAEGAWGGFGLLPQPIAQATTHFLGNSPATRFGTTLDKLVDPRKDALTKASNLLTGVKFTDVDTEKSRAVEARKAAEAILKATPGIARFENYYVSPEAKATLDPETEALVRLYGGMKQDAKAYHARREAWQKKQAWFGGL